MNKLTRTLAGISAMALMLSATSCFNSGDKNRDDERSQIQQMAETSYKAIEIDADLPFTEIAELIPVGDTGKLLASGFVEENGQYSVKGYLTDMDFSAFQEIDLGIDTEGNIELNSNFVCTNNGVIHAILTIVDYGDFELPDYNDPDFDYESFDYEAMQEAAEYTYKIMTIDESGNVIGENEIKGIEKYADESDGVVYLSECYAIGEDKICLSLSKEMDSTYVTVDADGNLSEPIDLGTDEYIYSYSSDRDNNFVYMTYEGSQNILKTVDGASLQVSPDVITLEDNMYLNRIIKGSGEYRIYASTSTSLYGMKDDGTFTELINWVDSDLTGDYIIGLIPIENGEFLVTEQNWSTGNTSVYRLTKRDAAEIGNVEVINMAMEYADVNVLDKVKEFNKVNSDYRIKVVDYSEYYEWDEESEKTINTPEKQLKQDIAAGKVYDIIAMSDTTGIFDNLSQKGALVDLYTYLDKDSELTRDDIVPTLLSVCEKDGKLTSLSPSFSVSTYACKTKHCDKENWTLDDFMEICSNLPEGMKPFADENTKTSIFYMLAMNGNNTFINYDEAVCDFNNPDFIEILEFCNQFPNAGEGDEIAWENVTDEELDEYFNKRETAIREDRALLYNAYFSSPRDYAHLRYGNFGDDVTFVGNPSSDGTGAQIQLMTSFAIMENSDNKDACWEFIKSMFSEKYQTSEYIYEFPALKSEFDKKFDEAMERPYYLDQNGKKVEYDDFFYDGVNEIKIDPLTQEECDFFKEYICNLKPNLFRYNNDVNEIISEEAEAYFNGDKTAEQTADIIQNRVSILISEQS